MPKVVMLAGRGESSNIVFNVIRPEAVILEERASATWNFLRRRIKKLGVGTVIGQMLFRLCIVPWLRRKSKSRIDEIKREHRLDDSAIRPDAVFSVPSVNDEATIRMLQELAPAVVVVNGTRIISERVLKSVNAVFLNTHIGITPQYRGVHGGYWALACGDSDNCGVTVHVVDPGIDTGQVVYQAKVEPRKSDNFVTYPYLQLAAAVPLLKRAVAEAAEGRLMRRPEAKENSKLWTHPTVFAYLRNLGHGIK